jgi:hypothetical protein
MELLFRDETYPEDGDFDIFLKALESDLMQIDSQVSLRSANIGKGADYPVVLAQMFAGFSWPSAAIVAGPVAFFFLGKRIKENTDAWLDLAKKLSELLKKRKPLRVDAKGGFLIAVNALRNENFKISDFDVSIQTVEHVDLGSMIATVGNLDRNPDATYQITFYRHGESHTFVIESTGEILFRRRFISNL